MNKTQSRITLNRITLTAVMAALSIILCRLLGFSPSQSMYRGDLGFLPIALIGIFAGPLWSAVGYTVADLIGAAIFTPPINPFITLCKFLFGLSLGLFLYRKKLTLPRIALVLLGIAVVIDVGCMSCIFVAMGYAPDLPTALVARLINAGVNYPVRVLVLFLVCRYALPPLFSRFGGAFGLRGKENTDFKSYANSFQTVSRLGLDRITALLDKLGNPEKALSCIHVAGTNGKGSVCAFLSSILREGGYSVGLYTSPNLVRVNERIVINGEPIGDADLDRLLGQVEIVAKDLSDPATQFEIWTAAAFLFFAERKVDYVVLETGLGGEFDATNVIPKNVMAILTKIDLDHTQYLGDTIAKIAETKSKIIKSACLSGVTVSAPQSPDAEAVIRARAAEVGVTPVFVDVPESEGFSGICERFSYRGIELAPSLGGLHQIENAAIAAEAALRLGIEPGKIARGIASARHPGRLEQLSSDPVILYDGGHNPNGITALNASLDRYFPGRGMTVIFACMKDKEIAPSLSLLAEPGREFLFTTVQNNPRALPSADLKEKAAALGIAGDAVPTLREAIEYAKARGKMILICGSLYLYADLPEDLRSL